ncbi:MAG: hypothetical protein WCO84_01160 [bacterium]
MTLLKYDNFIGNETQSIEFFLDFRQYTQKVKEVIKNFTEDDYIWYNGYVSSHNLFILLSKLTKKYNIELSQNTKDNDKKIVIKTILTHKNGSQLTLEEFSTDNNDFNMYEAVMVKDKLSRDSLNKIFMDFR